MIKKIIKYSLISLFLSLTLFKYTSILSNIKDVFYQLKTEPLDESYISDEMKYLKNYYLMKKGIDYYQAHYLSQIKLAGNDNTVWQQDIWGWRLPFIFYFWKYLTRTGSDILLLFIFLALITLTTSYFISIKFIKSKISLLTPLIILPYFLSAIQSTSFLFITWWSMFFYIIGVAFLFYQKHFLSAIFLSIAILTREFYLIPILIMLLISVFYHKNIKIFLLPLLLFFLMMIFHIYKVNQFTHINNSFGAYRLSRPNKTLVLSTLAFSTNSYFFVNYRPTLLFLAISVISLILLIIKSKDKYIYLLAISSFFPIFLSFFMINIGKWEDYWGATYVPLGIIYSVSIFKFLE